MARIDWTRIFVAAPGLRPTASEAFKPMAELSRTRAKVLLIGATADAIVPPEHTERYAVLLRQGGVLVVFARRTVINSFYATKSQVKCAGTSLFQLSRFFEAAMTTLLHSRAPT